VRVIRRRRSPTQGAPPTTQSHGGDSTGERIEYDLTGQPPQPASPLGLGDKQPFLCPFCGSDDCNAKAKLDYDGEPRLFITCFNDACSIPRRSYLPALSEALGIDGATPEEIAAALMERADPEDGSLNLSRAVVGLVTTKYRRP